MALRATAAKDRAGEELLAIEKRVASTVQEIESIKDTATVLQTEVAAGGFFDASDLAEVNAVLVQLRTDLQAATAAL